MWLIVWHCCYFSISHYRYGRNWVLFPYFPLHSLHFFTASAAAVAALLFLLIMRFLRRLITFLPYRIFSLLLFLYRSCCLALHIYTALDVSRYTFIFFFFFFFSVPVPFSFPCSSVFWSIRVWRGEIQTESEIYSAHLFFCIEEHFSVCVTHTAFLACTVFLFNFLGK